MRMRSTFKVLMIHPLLCLQTLIEMSKENTNHYITNIFKKLIVKLKARNIHHTQKNLKTYIDYGLLTIQYGQIYCIRRQKPKRPTYFKQENSNF